MAGGAAGEHLTERLRSHVYHLASEIGERNVFTPDALHAAEDYIRRTWSAQRYDVVPQEYWAEGVRSANLEATRPGAKADASYLLIGAHYDSVLGAPGANDNGSGVACLLELSRMFRHVQPRHPVRFVAFVNEEPPFFATGQQGSRRYAGAARQRGDNIRLMIALETIGYYSDRPGSQSYPPLFRYFYPDRANFASVVTNFRSRRMMLHFVRAFRKASDFPLEHVATLASIPGVSWSDHFWFWRLGYRALMVTDTAFYRYPWYHTAGDTAEKLDYERLAALTEGLFGAISILADEAG